MFFIGAKNSIKVIRLKDELTQGQIKTDNVDNERIFEIKIDLQHKLHGIIISNFVRDRIEKSVVVAIETLDH